MCFFFDTADDVWYADGKNPLMQKTRQKKRIPDRNRNKKNRSTDWSDRVDMPCHAMQRI